MSDKAKIKQEFKIVLRALLLSAPLGLTAAEIERDFYEAQGYGVPYRDLGYNSTSDLVEDLRDVAHPTWERGHAVFRGIADKTTKHIQSLVSRQNVNVSKCLKRRSALERQVARSRRSGPYSSGPGVGLGGGRRPNSYSGSNYPNSSGQPPRARRATVPSSSPAYLRTQLKALLNDHPNGILNTQFDVIYSRKFGFDMNYYKLGFSNLDDLVKSLPSLISVEQLGGGKYRVYSKENSPGTKAKQAKKLAFPIPDASRSMPFRSPQKKDLFKSSTTTSTSGTGRAKRYSSSKVNTKESVSSESTPSPREPTSISNVTNDLVDKELCDEIQKVLAGHEGGIFAASLPSEYKKLTGKELPLISIGFYSVVELVSAMPEIVAIQRQQKNSDWKLFDARTYVGKSPAEPESKKQSSSESSSDERLNDTKERIREVLYGHPAGLLLQNLAAAYEKYHKSALPCSEFGVHDVNSLVLAIPDTIKVVYKGQSQVFLHAQDQRLPLGYSPFTTTSKSIPQDAIGYGYTYPPARHPQLGEYFPIYISTVYTPHRISVQLKDKECNLALERLMDNLESVYSYPEGDKYLMPDAMIAVNQICCALYHEDNNWHRGLITGVPNIDLAEVLYVDYGTSLRVPKSSLRLLKSSFMKLPIQAIDAKLAGIEPVGDRWTGECKKRVLQLSLNKPLLAYAVEDKNPARDMNPLEEKSVLSLLLCDTSTEEDIHINDLLVQEGLAKFTPQEPSPTSPKKTSPQPPVTPSVPSTELSLEMLTGIGLPVPDDDPSLVFQWPDESAEVQQIIESGSGDDNGVSHHGQPTAGGSEVKPSTDRVDTASQQKAKNSGFKPITDTTGSDEIPPLHSGEDQDLIDQMCKELEEDNEEEGSLHIPMTVNCVDLVNGQKLHLISFGGQGQYVTSVEVSKLIWPDEDKEESALFDMIERKAAQLGQVIVEELENEQLAEDMKKEGVLLSPSQPSKLQLLLLTSVPDLVMVSGLAKPDLVRQLRTMAEEMPPLEDDDFSRESVSSETSSGMGTDLSHADLDVMYQVLQTKRERILKDLMGNSGVSNVDEMMHIEKLMNQIQAQLKRTAPTSDQRNKTSSSIDEIAAQFGRTALTPVTPTTPDDVFTSSNTSFPDSVYSADVELESKDEKPQIFGFQQRRIVSDNISGSQKQTAAISPLQRQSTGNVIEPKKSFGRGIARESEGLNMPVGLGRGQQNRHRQATSGVGMAPCSQDQMNHLNPNVPAFVPSPKRDEGVKQNLAPPADMPPLSDLFPNPFMPPLPLGSSTAMPPLQGMGGRPPAMPPFSNMGMFDTQIPPLPPVGTNAIRALPPDMMPPTSFSAQFRMPPPQFPPSQGLFNPAPGLPPPINRNPGMPAGFDLPRAGHMGFNPRIPPPPFGLGRGHQPWSIND